MIALIQRVAKASVTVDNQLIGKIDKGLLVFLAIETMDTEPKAKRLAERVAGYRIFADRQGKMNLNVQQINGEILVVSQFTLAADTQSGMRPSFIGAADHQLSKHLYHYFIDQLNCKGFKVATGQFAADMDVSLINDGPATFSLKA
jgi:D-tyrosyl-tRNA(Tyr) deacylase